jgi:hypothetical protein
MEVKAITLIVCAEAFLLVLLMLVAAGYYIRKLKRLLKKALEDSANAVVEPLGAQPKIPGNQSDQVDIGDSESNVLPESRSYRWYIDYQISALRHYHESLQGGRDIALDIDPTTPLERRIAAVRHAVLIAEREATLAGDVNWESLTSRYKALLSYYEDYPSPKSEARIHELTEMLNAGTQNAEPLEKFQ